MNEIPTNCQNLPEDCYRCSHSRRKGQRSTGIYRECWYSDASKHSVVLGRRCQHLGHPDWCPLRKEQT